ncbi:putative cation efflux transmembrane domain superfamily [Helianthus anomalus]
MEEGKEALLSPKTPRRGRRLSRVYSVNSLRTEFLTRLPNKVRSAIDIESSSFAISSKSSPSLTQGEKEYYEKQFATLKSFEEVDGIVSSDHGIGEEYMDEQIQQERAMKISNYANILLLAFKDVIMGGPNALAAVARAMAQIFATIETGSIAIAASTLDSLLDLMAGGILWFTHLSMQNINLYKYPIGKLRVQPVGIIIFAAIMATLGTLHVAINTEFSKFSQLIGVFILP